MPDDLQGVAARALRAIEKKIGPRRSKRFWRMGARAPWHHRHVCFRPVQERLAIRALADDVARLGLQRFARVLLHPCAGAGVAVAEALGLSVRAVQTYDVVRDETYMRLDVVGRSP